MKNNHESGFSMVELVIAVAVMGLLSLGVSTLMQTSNKKVTGDTEEIQTKILMLGAEKVIRNDLANAFVSFNYLNQTDDSGKWFYSFNKDFECNDPSCKKEITLKLNEGEVESAKSFFILTLSGQPKERLSLNIDPTKVFNDSTHLYESINYQASIDTDYDLSKSNIPDSPWDSNRILLLSSKIRLIDCKNGVLAPTTNCNFDCTSGGACNAPVKRKFKMLGVVSGDRKDLMYHHMIGYADIFKTEFKPCRLGVGNNCTYVTVGESGLKSSKAFYENLPFLPGYDNGTTLEPVELLRYSLVRDAGLNSNKFTTLLRESATFDGSNLSFSKKYRVLVGVESIVFTRKSVSNPTISFKIKKLSRYNNTETQNPN